VHALNSNTVFIGGSSLITDDYIAKSSNGGSVWQTANVESYIWNVEILKLVMQSASVGYAATRGNVLKTTDGGLNWLITDTVSVQAGSMFSILEDLALFPGSDTLFVCGWYTPYFGKTVNGGQDWQHQYTSDYTNLDFINSSIGYVGGWGKLDKTVDGGATFTDASGGSQALFTSIYSIDFTDEWTGYACGAGGKIIKTTNGGATALNEMPGQSGVSRVYPNPTRDKVYLNEPAQVRLSQMTGKVLFEASGVSSVDLKDYPSGLYILTVIDPIGHETGRFKVIKTD
jgi:photosystem II stability/assembly factor-like uncharacterized protein